MVLYIESMHWEKTEKNIYYENDKQKTYEWNISTTVEKKKRMSINMDS